MTIGTDDATLTRLRQWQEEAGTLPATLDLHRKLLSVQLKAKSQIGSPRANLSEQEIEQRLGGGFPMLEFTEIAIDWVLFRNIFKEAVDLIFEHTGTACDIPGRVTTPRLEHVLKRSVGNWFKKNEPINYFGKSNLEMLKFGIFVAMRPFLMGYREALLHLVDQDSWRHGYCPVCGGQPDFAFLDTHGARWLLCSRCDAEWLFQRLECPFCSSQNVNNLAYFTDSTGQYRLYVCEECRHYIKAIDMRKAGRNVLFSLERLVTADIDIQAEGQGYSKNGKLPRIKSYNEGQRRVTLQ